MRIHPRKRHKPQETGPKFRVNAEITAPQVRVVDEEEGNLGVMDTRRAIELAQEKGLDLVEVSPKAEPPVCKILSFGQFKYEKEREARKNKQKAKTTEIKGIRLTPRIGAHDLEVRVKTAERFLEDGNKIKVEMRMRGREKAFVGLARETVEGFIASLRQKYDIIIEQPIQKNGGQLTAIIAKK